MYVTEGRRSSLGLMQSLPHPEVCRVKIYALWLMIFYSHSFQPASLPANPPTPGLLGFMCRQTKTLTRTETRAVIWSHLMVKERNGSNIFYTEDWFPVYAVHKGIQPLLILVLCSKVQKSVLSSTLA